MENQQTNLDDKAILNKETTESTSATSKAEETPKNQETNTTTALVPIKDKETESVDEIKLTHIDKDFAYDVMSIPTHSSSEYRLVTYIILWARKNNIKYEFDEYGNVYLTKGELSEGEYYPCVTSHLDTVQTKQRAYAQAGVRLPIKTTIIANNRHKLSVDGMGIGADDKSGVLICLSLFSHIDKLKACFFLEEETGMKGSIKLNADWFKDVGYVIGYDSPELNRAAYCCSGTKLFDRTFFDTYMKDVCKKHGVDNFNSEPFTDVIQIRNKTQLVCMNFGNGGYEAHSATEYCVLEDMDNACRMGQALIEKIGRTQHILETTSTYGGGYTTSGYYRHNVDSDDDYYREVAGKQPYRTTYDTSTTYTAKTTTAVNNTTVAKSAETTQSKLNENVVPIETLDYIVNTYEQHIDDIKVRIEAKCKDMGISFDEFATIFDTTVSF